MSQSPSPAPQPLPPIIRAAYEALLSTGHVVSIPIPAHGANTAAVTADPTPSIRPDDRTVGVIVTILDLPQGVPVVATASASAMLPSGQTDTALPLTGFVVTTTPPVVGGTLMLTVGDGLQVVGAEYVISLAIAVGGTGESIGALTMMLPCAV